MEPKTITGQLTQIFTDEGEARTACAMEIKQSGAQNVRFYKTPDVQVDDRKSTPPKIGAYMAAGNPLYVVQTDYP